jgi:uncharacterized protein
MLGSDHQEPPGKGEKARRSPLRSNRSIPFALYDEVRSKFASFARRAQYRALWETLSRDADDGDAIPVQRFRYPKPLLELPGAQGLLDRRGAEHLVETQRVGIAGSETASAELVRWAVGLSQEELVALDVILWRALNAYDALELIHPDDLLPEDCLALLNLTSRPAEIDRVVEPRPGKTMDYTGYACIILKATRRCNLRCVYCHDWQDAHSPIMPIILQATLFRRLFHEARFSVIDIVWHGGEPTLLGRARMQKALFLQRHFCDERQIIRNVVQTNGTLIDEDWVKFLKRFRFRVGVSIDGPADVHDRTRFGLGGRPSSALVRRGIRLLKEAGLLSGVLIVATPQLVELGPAALLDFLETEGVSDASILAVRPGYDDVSPNSILPAANYVAYLIEVEIERRRRGRHAPRIREIETAYQAAAGRPVHHCELLGHCIGAFFAVEPDGSVWHCDKFTGDDAYKLGNITTDDFESLRTGMVASRLRKGVKMTLERFSYCAYRQLCQGWCPHEHYVANLDADRSKDCCGLGPLFAFLQEGGRTAAMNDVMSGTREDV